jgi:hypothetical protein
MRSCQARQEHVSAGVYVVVHTARGEIDEAIRWLHTGRARRDGFFVQLKSLLHATPLVIDSRLAEEFARVGFR